MKSTDHGATWTDPVHVYGNVAWTDKPEVTSNASGKDIYVSWNGPRAATSTSASRTTTARPGRSRSSRTPSATTTPTTLAVLSDGTVVFAESSLRTPARRAIDGDVWHHAIISRNHGATWENVVVAKVPIGEPCVADGCGPDFYTGQASVAQDAPGHLVFAFEGPAADGGPSGC